MSNQKDKRVSQQSQQFITDQLTQQINESQIHSDLALNQEPQQSIENYPQFVQYFQPDTQDHS